MDKDTANYILQVDSELEEIREYLAAYLSIPCSIKAALYAEINRKIESKIQIYDTSIRQLKPDTTASPEYLSYVSKIF